MDTKSKDLEAWMKWKQSGSKKDMAALIQQISPIIYNEVHRASGSLPKSALSGEAKLWAIKAIKTFDPERGVALNTHVSNYLPKVRRLNYQYQNNIRLPENQQLKYHEYNRQLSQLSDLLNREPTDEELAKALGWSKPHVIKFRNSLFADMMESSSDKPSEFTQFNERSILMAHILDQLTPEEKIIFDHANKTPATPATQVADILGVNLNRYNYLKSKLKSKMAGLIQEVGL